MKDSSQQIAWEEIALPRDRDTTACDDAFAALAMRYSRFVFRVAYAVLRNSHDSEDVVQETFLKIYRGKNWHRIEDERAFLARAAWRIATAHRRKCYSDLHEPEIISAQSDPEQAAETVQLHATLHRLIDALPEELRYPLALSSVNEMNSREIAKILGIPDGTVRNRLMRARTILKRKLEAMMGGHGAE